MRSVRSLRMSFSAMAALIAGGAVSIGADQTKSPIDLTQAASGFHALFLHDNCTGDYPPQPDTCLHKQLIEKSFTFGGSRDVIYDVRLRIRGIFEPTTIVGGEAPYPDHPYFKIGGTVEAREWSAWHIQVSSPKQTYWLNHYPTVSHTIYAEDFEATIPVAGEAAVVVRVSMETIARSTTTSLDPTGFRSSKTSRPRRFQDRCCVSTSSTSSRRPNADQPRADRLLDFSERGR